MNIDEYRSRYLGEGAEDSIESRLIHLADPADGDGPVVPSIPASTTYAADCTRQLAERFQSIIDLDPSRDRFVPEGASKIYLRLGNEIEWKLCEALALAQGGETALMFSDGMGAVKAAVSFRTNANSEIVCAVPVYGCTDNLFTGTMPREGRTVRFADLRDPEALRPLINRRTRVVYLETLANPNLRMFDLAGLKQIVLEANEKRFEEERIILVIDNTFMTPCGCNPFAVGPELEDMIVLHSTTKGINGFSSGVGGVCVMPWKYWKDLFLYRKDTGGTLAPAESHGLLTRSVRTMSMRFHKAQQNAQAVAELCAAHPAVSEVIYPGLPDFPDHELARQQLRDWDGNFAPGHMLAFVMSGDTDEARLENARRLLDSLRVESGNYLLAVSLGYVGTLMEDPNSGTHATVGPEERDARGIIPGLVRLSTGIERKDDLVRDLLKALDSVEPLSAKT
jgi:methionine-gamma-lyase